MRTRQNITLQTLHISYSYPPILLEEMCIQFYIPNHEAAQSSTNDATEFCNGLS